MFGSVGSARLQKLGDGNGVSSDDQESANVPTSKKAYRWKAKLLRSQEDDCTPRHFFKGYRRVHLPQVFGIGNNGTWRWRLLPLEVDAGIVAEMGLHDKDGAACVELEPLVRVRPARWRKKHGLDAEVTVLPRLEMRLGKSFSAPGGRAKVTASAQGFGLRNLSFRCEWRSGTASSSSWPEARLHTTVDLPSNLGPPREGKAPGGALVIPGVGLKLRKAPRPGCWVAASISAEASTARTEHCRSHEGGSGARRRPWWIRPVQLPAHHEASLSASFLGDTFGRDVQSLDIVDSETQQWQLQGGSTSKRKHNMVTRQIGVVAGHWIDPGDETGAPGERAFNMEVADCLEEKLEAEGWRVFRPDRHAVGLDWDDYLRWVARQSRRGTPVIEIHGQGKDAAVDGVTTGVVGCRAAPINQSLAAGFGFFPMDWTGMAVPRQGGVIVESFVTDEVNAMNEEGRLKEACRISSRIAESVRQADTKVRAKMLTVESGCSTTGCPIGRYGHELEAEATQSNLLAPSHPLGGSPMLQDSLLLPGKEQLQP